MDCLAFAYLLNICYQHDKEFNPIDKKSLLYLTCRLYHISSQEFDNNLYIIIQDHQRWGYSTVIHLEKTIYLAIWKDLNKEKRKEQ